MREAALGAPKTKKFEIETDCINQLMSGVYELEVSLTARDGMRRAGVDLTDVQYVGSTGRVVHSDMLGNRGLWVVRGDTVEGVAIDVTVAVVSSEYEVEVREVCSVKVRGNRS